MDFVCTILGGLGGSCQKTADICVSAQQELFSGLAIEPASPNNMKPWTGLGGGGKMYSTAAVCLLRDLQTSPVAAHAEAQIPLGTVTVDQNVRFTQWDRGNLKVAGVHTGRICAPVIGCLDGYVQNFSLQAQSWPGMGQSVGAYKVNSVETLLLDTQGFQQGVAATLPAFTVVTPYGPIEAKPTFAVGRRIGWVLAPYYGGNVKSVFPLTSSEGTFPINSLDLYGRWPGLKRSQEVPYKMSSQGWVPSNVGWISQAAIGGRTALPSTTLWAPPPGIEYPLRPDVPMGNTLIPRVDLERLPNASMGAAVKLVYAPLDLFPEWIRNSPFLNLDFQVYVTPNIEAGASTQFDIASAEASHWQGQVTTWAPVTPNVTPDQLGSQHHFNVFSGASAAARFALDAGVRLKIILKIPLLLKTIKKTIIDINPTTTVAEVKDEGHSVAPQSASFSSDSKLFASTGMFFSKYRTLAGATPTGLSHIQACLAQPNATQPAPAPGYTPGNPQDLVQDLQMPCNICVGMEAQDFDTQGPNGTEHHHIDGFLTTIKPVDQSNKPVSSRWTCKSLQHVGCYDMCAVSQNGATMTVAETAIEMLAKGELKSTGHRMICQ